jgi:uncharacterized protein YbaR (Trm112 family)
VRYPKGALYRVVSITERADTDMVPDYLACPGCQSVLTKSQERMVCSGCGKGFPVLEGIPSFADPEFYWGEIDEEQMMALLRLIDGGEDGARPSVAADRT